MKATLHLAVALICAMSVSSVSAEEPLGGIKYEVASYDRWPVIAFLDIDGIPESRALHPEAMARNSGYAEATATIPARNINWPVDDPGMLHITLTWYERVTETAYSARISVDSQMLQPDPVQRDLGVLILRIAGRGDLEAVTFDQNQAADGIAPRATVLQRVCAEKIALSDPDQLAALQRMLGDQVISAGTIGHAAADEIPSNCP